MAIQHNLQEIMKQIQDDGQEGYPNFRHPELVSGSLTRGS